ncbi:MAG: aspartate kinase, partial [Poseidonibacter sp.]
MNIKVCKFGGSSVRDSSQIKKVLEIIKKDKNRRVIVVSAPGRDEKFDEKITDHLLNIATNGEHFSKQKIYINIKQSFDSIINKFELLCTELNIDKKIIIEDLKKDLNNTVLKNKKREAFFLSRGEHYNSKIISTFIKNSGLN